MAARKMRLDQLLVARDLVPSRTRAQARIMAGDVFVNGQRVDKAGTRVPEDAPVELRGDDVRFVSRGGLKLQAALDAFSYDPTGKHVLDVGASTGGFTEVLLSRGATRVHALDVGHGQLHPTLKSDPRVRSLEGINARNIPTGLIPPVDWIVTDVSFIGLEKALPGALALARPGATLVALIKPQFEAGPGEVGRDGVLKNDALIAEIRARIPAWLTSLGWTVTHEGESPILGGSGNREYLVAARLQGNPQ